MGDEVFYKRENENEWRGPAKVVGVSGKTVVVKHGDSLREIARVHITRIQGTGKEDRSEAREVGSLKDESGATAGENLDTQERENTAVGCRREDREGDTEESEEEANMVMGCTRKERERDSENSEEQDGDEDNVVEELPRLRKGNRIRAINRDTGQREEWTILSLAGKRASKNWSDSYNVQDSQSGDRGWINLRDYSTVERIDDEEEILLGFENKNVIEAKERELQSWRENNVYVEVEDVGQKAISTRWIVTEKIKKGEKICKARLVARGFEEEMAEWEKDAPTCNAETLKFCLTVMKLKKWTSYTLDVKTAYLQGEEIQREVYLKPPSEEDWSGLWKLKKTVYGLKDAAKA